MKRQMAGSQRGGLARVMVDACDMMAGVCQTAGGDKSDIAGTDDRDLHGGLRWPVTERAVCSKQGLCRHTASSRARVCAPMVFRFAVCGVMREKGPAFMSG